MTTRRRPARGGGRTEGQSAPGRVDGANIGLPNTPNSPEERQLVTEVTAMQMGVEPVAGALLRPVPQRGDAARSPGGVPVRGLAAPLIKLAIFTVVTVLSVAVLLTAVQNSYFGSTEDYKARFTDASGLIAGSDVRIAGVRVGQVPTSQLVDRDIAEVTFKVDEARKLPVGSIFSIKYQNLVGQRYLEVARGNGPMNAMLRPGATIPVNQTRPPLNLTVVFNGFKPLFQALSPNDINQLSFEIIQVLQGEGGTVNSLLARTASLTSTIADRDAVIGSLITNLNTVLDTVNARDERLSGLIVSLQQLVSGLAADRVAIGETLQPIADLTTTTAGLLEEARPPLRDDIVQLGRLSANLNDNRDLVERVPAPHAAEGEQLRPGRQLRLLVQLLPLRGGRHDQLRWPPSRRPRRAARLPDDSSLPPQSWARTDATDEAVPQAEPPADRRGEPRDPAAAHRRRR